jgi:octaprenyl-diphosphate synthase
VLQLRHAGNLLTSMEQYMEVVDRKSAALIAWCAAAAAFAKGDMVAAEALQRFGRGVGRAFQITDDVLDYCDGTGKNPGVDLLERKVTLPLIVAMARVNGLHAELNAGPPTPQRLPRLMRQVRESGALEASLEAARSYADDAMSALDILPVNEGREALRSLGHYLADRTR